MANPKAQNITQFQKIEIFFTIRDNFFAVIGCCCSTFKIFQWMGYRCSFYGAYPWAYIFCLFMVRGTNYNREQMDTIRTIKISGSYTYSVRCLL